MTANVAWMRRKKREWVFREVLHWQLKGKTTWVPVKVTKRIPIRPLPAMLWIHGQSSPKLEALHTACLQYCCVSSQNQQQRREWLLSFLQMSLPGYLVWFLWSYLWYKPAHEDQWYSAVRRSAVCSWLQPLTRSELIECSAGNLLLLLDVWSKLQNICWFNPNMLCS